MNVTITLIMYWSIAIALAGGGIYSLKKGFELIKSGKGKTKEENSVEFLGLKASLSSIGSLVMITAFMWAWAANRTLPNYKDENVTITALMKDLNELQKLNIAQKNELNAMRKIRDSLVANIEEPDKNQELGRAIYDHNRAIIEYESAIKSNDQDAAQIQKNKILETKKEIERVMTKLERSVQG